MQMLEKLVDATGRSISSSPIDAAEAILTVDVTSKRFDPARTDGDPKTWKFEDNIWWDATYTAVGLEKDARSIKGVLKFCDLFGEPQFQVRVTIDDPISPEGVVSSKGIGIEYNQFDSTHKWLRSTSLDDMTVRFQVDTILYTDKTTEKFGE